MKFKVALFFLLIVFGYLVKGNIYSYCDPSECGWCTGICIAKCCDEGSSSSSSSSGGFDCSTCACGCVSAGDACKSNCCTPDCTGKNCGDDGCGGSCGTCTSPASCVSGTCCTNSAPTAPTQISPADGRVYMLGDSVTLDWNHSSTTGWGTNCSGGIKGYDLCVGSNSPSSCETSISYLDPTTTRTWTPTTARGIKTWSVRTDNGALNSAWVSRNYCVEGGPYISAWTAWTYNATTNKRTTTRTCNEDCGEGTASSECAAYFNDTTTNCLLSGGVCLQNAVPSNPTTTYSYVYSGGVYTQTVTQTDVAPGAPTLTAPSGEIPVGSTTAIWTGPSDVGFDYSGTAGYYNVCFGTGTTAANRCTLLNVNDTASPYAWTNAVTGNNYASVAYNNGSLFGPYDSNLVCVEGGPYVSVWTNWSVCNASHKRTRTRTCTEDCSTVNDCSNTTLSETEDCSAAVTGTIFDASDVATCADMAAAPKITSGTFSVTSSYGSAISSNPFSLTTDAGGNYSFSPYLTGGSNTYTYDFSNLVTEGKAGSATPKLYCNDAIPTVLGCDVAYTGTQPCRTSNFSFGLYRLYDGWWQVTGGKVHADQGIKSTIPSSITASNQRLILKDTNGKDGLVTYNTTLNLGSNPNLLVSDSTRTFKQTYQGQKYDYDYFSTKLNTVTSKKWSVSGSLPVYDDGGKGYMVVKYTGSTNPWVMPTLSVASGEKYIFLVPVNVLVQGYINVADGGYLAVISNGTITFDKGLGRNTSADTSKNFEGVFIAETINVESTGDKTTEKQFYGEGSFIGWTNILLTRDRGAKNNTEPSEEFVARTDLMTNTPEVIKFPYTYYSSFNP